LRKTSRNPPPRSRAGAPSGSAPDTRAGRNFKRRRDDRFMSREIADRLPSERAALQA